MVAGRMSVEEMRGVIEEAERRAAEKAARAASKPATMQDVVDQVNEILGVRQGPSEQAGARDGG